MTPDEYLEHVARSSAGGRMAAGATELQEAMTVFGRGIMQHVFHEREEAGLFDAWEWQPEFGPDPLLMDIRDTLVPYFPPACREDLARVPIGKVYDITPNAYSTLTPDGNGAIVCVSSMLTTVLNLVAGAVAGSWMASDTRGHLKERTPIIARAGSKALQAIDALVSSTRGSDVFVSPPMPAAVTADAMTKAADWTSFQLLYAVAHELGHIAAGHLAEDDHEPGTIRQAQELEADHIAGGVMLDVLRDRAPMENQIALENRLGLISGVFWAGQAIFDFSNRGYDVVASHPHANDRFAVVIDRWRDELGLDLMGVDIYMRPCALVCEIVQLITRSPVDAVMLLSEMAYLCDESDDHLQAAYTLAMARDVAKEANEPDVASQISDFLEQQRIQHNVILPLRDRWPGT